MNRSTRQLRPILHRLYEARNELRRLHPDLKFTLDGNLVGDIGEAIAQEHFGLEPLPANTKGHDFRAADGRLVQVKTTQKQKGGVGLGLKMQSFEHLIVIQLTEAGDYGILYDGPGRLIDQARIGRKTPSLSVNQLQQLQEQVPQNERLATLS